ncbi:hypothetical protein V6N11_079204 [Hibiscus sabdariffa]|uniref:Uncharacterized protein n=1 Tax=Hibiscus sabdariffa TaxID=183260 RepID=A0ABR2RV24_9ROSI
MTSWAAWVAATSGMGSRPVTLAYTTYGQFVTNMVVVLEVLQVDAAATPLDGGASNLSFNRRLLQVPANPWQRGCSRHTRCRGGSRRPGGPGIQGK